MKFSKYFMLAGAAAMLAACSSEEPVPAPGGMPADVAEADAYGLISLQMPSQTETRAAVPETSLIESEYKIYSAQLLVFKAASDAEGAKAEDATYVTSATITTNWKDHTASDDISRESYGLVTFAKGTFEVDADYYACIIANAPATGYTWPTTDQTFSAWSTTAQNVGFKREVNGATYLTMASAPEYTEDGVVTLQKIEGGKLKKDIKELNEADPMARFYIHRVGAKIEVLANNASNHEYTIQANGQYKGDKVVINGWAADNKATEAYPILNTTGLDLSAAHMHGGTGGVTGFGTFARCFWGKGAYYGAASAPTLEKGIVSSFPTYEYVKENTMPYNKQQENRATRVVLKATYTLKGQAATTLVKVGKNALQLLSKEDLLADIKAKAEVTLNSKNITVTPKQTSFEGGYISLSNFCTVTNGTTEVTDLNAIATQLGLTNATVNEIALYAHGVCYYTAYIKHFGDDEAPLGSTEITTAADYKKEHEGRWGVVRNNWYQVNVQSFSKIGEPTIPTPTDDPLDKEKDEVQAMDYNIYMLNWAKRTQNENF